MPDPSANPSPAIEFAEVSYTYPGADAPALERVSLRVERGERLGVVGPNGGGKSTLLRIAMGLARGYTGSVRVFGEPPNRARRNGRIAAVLQQCEAEVRFPISVAQAVTLAASRRVAPWRRTGRAQRDRAMRSLTLVGADRLADRPVGALSVGQLQRVLIARAIAAEPDILALDEPTVGIDPEGQARFAEVMRRVHASLGLTILIVSHDVRAVAAGCDRVACLSRTLHYHDAPEGLTPQILAEVFKHEVAGAFGEVHVEAHRAADCPTPHAHTGASTPTSGAKDA